MEPGFQGRISEDRGKRELVGNWSEGADGKRQGTMREERWKDEMGEGFRHVNEPLARLKQDRTNVWQGDGRLAFGR